MKPQKKISVATEFKDETDARSFAIGLEQDGWEIKDLYPERDRDGVVYKWVVKARA